MPGGPAVSAGGPIIAAVPHRSGTLDDEWAPDARALDLVGDKWTLLIVRDLVAGPAASSSCNACFRHLDRAAAVPAEPDGGRRAPRRASATARSRARRLRADRALRASSSPSSPSCPAGASRGRGDRRGRARRSTSAPSSGPAPGLCIRSDVRGTVELRVDGRSYCLALRPGAVELTEGSPTIDPTRPSVGTEADWSRRSAREPAQRAERLRRSLAARTSCLDAVAPSSARPSIHAA